MCVRTDKEISASREREKLCHLVLDDPLGPPVEVSYKSMVRSRDVVRI
jgi:hypothetical protein